jgi:signal transduction histidine kinase
MLLPLNKIRPFYRALLLGILLSAPAATSAWGRSSSQRGWPEHLVEEFNQLSQATVDQTLTFQQVKQFQDNAITSGNKDCISTSYYTEVYYFAVCAHQMDSALMVLGAMESEEMNRKDINSAQLLLIYHYQYTGEYEKALAMCREILKTSKDKVMTAEANFNIIQIYMNMDMLKQGLAKTKELCNFSLGITDKANYHYGLAIFYSNAAQILLDEGNKAEALTYLQKCDSTWKHDGKHSPTTAIYDLDMVNALWGRYYLETKDYPKFWNTVKLLRGNGPYSIDSYYLEASYYLQNKDFAKAKAVADKMNSLFGEEESDAIGDNVNLLNAQIAEGNGFYQEAADYYSTYISKRDSILRIADKFRTSECATELNLNKASMEAAEYQAQAEHYRIKAVSIILIVLIFISIAAVVVIIYLQKLNRKLNETDKMKSSFIQNMSHEIRTPLNSIVGFSELMVSDADHNKEYSDIIKVNSGHLLSIVKSTLELSDIENSIIEKEPTNVNDCFEAVIQDVRSKIPAGVELQYAPCDKELTVRSNAGRLKELIRNLLDNSIKYTEKGSIAMGYDIEESRLHIYVKDTGCGIPADKADWVFERFTKMDDFAWGSGLGLPISKKIVEKLGGTINVDTSYSKGCKIDVLLEV